MKRTLLLKSVLSMMLLGMGLNAWSVETPYKTLTFSASTNGASVGSYTTEWTATIDDFTWNLANFNNNNNKWEYVKCGRKGNESVATITTTSAIDETISKVVVTVDAVTTSYVNTTYLEVASDADFTSPQKIEITTLSKGENTYTVTTPSANQYYRLTFDCASAGSNGVIQISKVEYYYSSDKTVTTASFPAATYTAKLSEGFDAPQVSITPAAAASEGTITYFVNNESVATIDESTGKVSLVGAGTAKVTAKYTGSDKYEDCEANYTLLVYEKSYSTMQELQEAATDNSTPVMFTFTDIYVTAVKSSNAYISDGTYGALIYTSGHGLTAGTKINGSTMFNLQLFRGQTEITDFSKEGLDIQEATISPTEADFEIAKGNQSALVTIPNAKFSGGMLEYDYGTIKYYDNFSTKVALEEGKIYNVTGIVVVYNDDIEICPRTADDVVKISSSGKTEPTLSATYKEELKLGETDSYVVTYDGDGTLSAKSSDTNVATVEINGTNVTVTSKAVGTTTITISATETATYEGASFEYTLKVEDGEMTVSTIAAVQEKGAGDYKIEGTVVAVCTRGALVYDTTGYIYIFDANGVGAAVGDEVTVEGTTSKYGGFQQFSATKGYTLTKTGTTTVTHPTADELDLDAWADAPVMQYVKLSGTLAISGTHYNVTVAGKTVQGSLIYPTEEISEKLANNSRITVYGYAIYKNTSSGVTYVNIIATSVESETSTKKESTITLSVDPATELSVGGSDTYTITYDGDGELSVVSSNPEFATATLSGNKVTVLAVAAGSATITISATEGEEYYAPKDYTYTLTIVLEGVDNFTWDSTQQNYEAQQTDEVKCVDLDVVTSDSDPVTIKFGQGTANQPARYYFLSGKNVAAVRFYKNNTLTISAPEGQAISGITFNYVSSYVNTFTPNVGSYSVEKLVGTWSGISTVVTLTNLAGAARFTSITVSYVPLTIIPDMTAVIPETGKATYSVPKNCIIGDGTVSKYITGRNGYTLIEEDAPVVFGGEGVLLTGEPGEYKLYTHEALSAKQNLDNYLRSGADKTYAPLGSYVLQKKDDSPKFYKVATNDIKLNGHAYLSSDILLEQEASGIKVLYFTGDDATAIEEVNEIAEAEGATYNLQGVQVNSSYKGIVIRGGKKFLNK